MSLVYIVPGMYNHFRAHSFGDGLKYKFSDWPTGVSVPHADAARVPQVAAARPVGRGGRPAAHEGLHLRRRPRHQRVGHDG